MTNNAKNSPPPAWGHPAEWDDNSLYPERPVVKYTGWWIYLVRPEEWPTVSAMAGHALSRLWHEGYRSLDEILQLNDNDLLDIDGIGPARLEAFSAWKQGRSPHLGPEWAGDVNNLLNRIDKETK